MTVLTWKNVDAPDISDSLDAYRLSSDMLSKGLAAAKSGLQEVEADQTGRANRAVMTELMAYQSDPERLSADLANGTLQQRMGKDWARMDAGTLNAISKAPADFLAFAGDKLKMQGDVIRQGELVKTVADNDKVRALRLPMNQYQEALGKGDKMGAEMILANNPTLRELSPDDFKSLMTSGQDLRRGDISNDSATNSLAYTKITQAHQLEDRDADLLSRQMVDEAVTSGDNEAWLNTNRERLMKLNPRAYTMAIEKIRASSPSGSFDAPGGVADSGGSIGSSGDAERIVNYEAKGKTGISSVPASVQTLGQLVDWGKSLNNRGVKSSATGLFQITQSTYEEFGQKALGAGWRDLPPDAENQNKVAEQIFLNAARDKSGAALKARWVSLSSGEARELANGSWANARGIIAQKESGGTINPRRAGMAIRTAATQANVGDPLQETARKFLELAGDRSNATQIAAKLIGKGGALEGDNKDAIEARIYTMTRNNKGLNFAQAGEILADSKAGTKSFLNFTKNITDIGGVNAMFDENIIKERIALVTDRKKLTDLTVGMSDTGAALGGMDQADALVASARQAYEGALRAAQVNGRGVPGRFKQTYDDAIAAQAGAYRGAAPQGTVGQEDTPAPPARRGGRDFALVPEARAAASPAVTITKSREFSRVIVDDIKRIAGAIPGPRDVIKTAKVNNEFKRLYGMTTQQAAANPLAAMASRKRMERLLAQGAARRDMFK